MRANVEPGEASPERPEIEVVPAQIRAVDVADARRWPHCVRDVGGDGIVKVQACHGPVVLWRRPLFFNADRPSLAIEFDMAMAPRIPANISVSEVNGSSASRGSAAMADCARDRVREHGVAT